MKPSDVENLQPSRTRTQRVMEWEKERERAGRNLMECNAWMDKKPKTTAERDNGCYDEARPAAQVQRTVCNRIEHQMNMIHISVGQRDYRSVKL